ncbi:MAG TPA: aminoglycoside phosphotransferase family protein [Actinomycetes bacterium]
MIDDGVGDTGRCADRHLAPGVPERLRAWVRRDFGIDLTSIHATGQGADVAAQLWHGVADDGARYAVKWSAAGTPGGLLVSAQLAARQVAGAVRPVPARDGRPWSHRQGRRLSVLPWVSDRRAMAEGLQARGWRAFGALLAQVHATPAVGAVAALLPRDDHTHHRITAAVHALQAQLAAPTQPANADPLIRALAQQWQAKAELIWTLLEHADRLAPVLRARAPAMVVCHGDPHLGNLLVGDQGQVWLIDWDNAVVAARERDLMFVVDGVISPAAIGPRERSWFFDGYGSVDLDQAGLDYQRCTRALDDLIYDAEQVVDVDRYSPSQRRIALHRVRQNLDATGLAHRAGTVVERMTADTTPTPPNSTMDLPPAPQ